MKTGDIVFFKKLKVSLSRTSEEIGFKGHGWGVLLGMVPPFLNLPPSAAIVFRTFGEIGLISFDDIAQFLGKEQAEIVIEKFKEKYGLKTGALVKPSGPKILGLNGAAIEEPTEPMEQTGEPGDS